MSKIKSLFSAVLVSAAATAALTCGVMATTASPLSLTYTPDKYSVTRSTNNVNTYKEEFNSLVGSKFTVNGVKATLSAQSSGFNGNCKYVSVSITGVDNSVKYAYGAGTGESYAKSADYSGTIKKASYVGTTYAGSDMTLELSEYKITVNKN